METIFKRHELKYILTPPQKAQIMAHITAQVPPDIHGEYLVQSLYFDTPDWAIIRHSIDSPVFKEKLRLRCYNVPGQDATMYLELKKKLKDTVYKRRISFLAQVLKDNTPRAIAAGDTSQIGRELDHYLHINPVAEKAHVSCHRQAFGHDQDLRITLDTNIRFRTHQLDYQHPGEGLLVLPDDLCVMEVKTRGGMPLWLSHAFSQYKLFPRPFSKYGAGYKKYILKGGNM